MGKIIEKILNKISKYDILINYIPGSVFVCCCKYFGIAELLFNNMIVDIPIIYFFGLLSELIGDLPIYILRKFKVINYANYDDFIKADKRYNKINIISRKVSMLKAIIGSHILLMIFIVVKKLNSKVILFIIIIIFIVLEIIRINKEIGFIKARIKENSKVCKKKKTSNKSKKENNNNSEIKKNKTKTKNISNIKNKAK